MITRVMVSGLFAGSTVGSGQYTDRLVEALRARASPGATIEVVAPGHGVGRWSKVVFEQIVFPRLARGVDVAHVPYWAPPLAIDAPCVVTIHDLIPMVLPDYHAGAAVRAYVALVARATRRVDAVLTDSHHTASDVLARLDIDPSRVHVVPLGVGPEYRPCAGAAEADADRAACDALGLPDRFGLYVGGFDPRKNVITLLAAWRSVYARLAVPLVLAGASPRPGDTFSRHPRETARHVGLPDAAFRVIGAVTPALLPAVYRRARVMTYPSAYEGFGLPPLEAMACATPVVAAAATSLPEVIGDAGILVPAHDVQAWAAAIERVLGDDEVAARLSAAGSGRARAFSWAATAERTWAVYEIAARRER